MTRGVLAFLVLLVAVASVAAQAPVETVHMTIHPAAAPVPALRYRLLPEVADRSPGNAALLYQRAHSPEWLGGAARQADYHKKIEDWLKMPLKDLPRDEVRRLLPRGALAEVELAARREYCDWELAPRARTEGIGLLLPELQTFREFGTLLSLKARLEMAEGNYAQAARTLETGFSLGRHVAEGPTLINALVGLAIVQVMAARVQELMELPDAPNLYWALTALPRPVIDMRRSLQGERLFIDSLFPGIREALADPKAAPLSVDQMQKMVGGLTEQWDSITGGSESAWQRQLGVAVMVAKEYPEAKKLLIALGRTAEQAEAMPMQQAVIMFQIYHYDRLFDDMLKWQGLPYAEVRRGSQQVEQELRQCKAANSPGMTLATLLLPAITKVNEAAARADRRIALLRTVEALRLYAAAHDGKLPTTLDDVREAPLPLDPYTGKPFEYHMVGDKATLHGPPPPGEQPTSSNSLRYEVTLKGK